MVSIPLCWPRPLGTKLTEKVQVECAFSELPHPLTTVKSPLVTCAVMSVKATSPALMIDTVWFALAVLSCCEEKLKEVSERVSVAGLVAVPLRLAVWVPASSTTVKDPERAPVALGAKTIETVHPVCELSVVPQVFAVILKSPETTGVCIPAVALPVFEMVMFCTALVAPTLVTGKVAVVGVRTMAAAGVPVPDSMAVACPPATLPYTVSTPVRAPVEAGANRTCTEQVDPCGI